MRASLNIVAINFFSVKKHYDTVNKFNLSTWRSLTWLVGYLGQLAYHDTTSAKKIGGINCCLCNGGDFCNPSWQGWASASKRSYFWKKGVGGKSHTPNSIWTVFEFYFHKTNSCAWVTGTCRQRVVWPACQYGSTQPAVTMSYLEGKALAMWVCCFVFCVTHAH